MNLDVGFPFVCDITSVDVKIMVMAFDYYGKI